MSDDKKTPLYDLHCELGARMVPFAGFAMPVQYSSIVTEHKAVREQAGLFDVSHMGQIYFQGPEALASVEKLVTCPVASMAHGQVRYGLLCNEAGGVVDDVTVYRIADDHFFLCVNAANIEKDEAWIRANSSEAAGVNNRSEELGLLALQGPASPTILASLTDFDLDSLRRYRFAEAKVNGAPVLISRTGYTGSDGFELYVNAADSVELFRALIKAGKDHGLIPAGLGARDTLRLEAAMPLYGHELDDERSPLAAGLERFIKLKAGGFIGAEAVAAAKAQGIDSVLVGFELVDKGVARAEYPVEKDGETVGIVTSGAPSPALGKSIGLAYVPSNLSELGTELEVRVRARALRAKVVSTPFS